MLEKYTHISVILDRTGSMSSIRDDVIGGFNTFLKTQKEVSGKATMTLVQFDTQDPYEVIHRFEDIQSVKELTTDTYVPRAMTPLLDAMGRGIHDLEESLAKIKEEGPSKIVVVVITDGQENSSKEFKKDQIQKMVKEKQETSKWEFVFLSADMKAVDDAVTTGVSARNTLAFDRTSKGVRSAFASTAENLANLRGGSVESMAYSAEDRDEQIVEKTRTEPDQGS